MPFRGAGTRLQALKNGLFYWDGSPLLHSTQDVLIMTLAELYEALGKLENGAEMTSAVKTEISRLNGESAKFRTSKNEADAKIAELTAKGTGDQSAAEKMQKQLDELKEKYEVAENARKEEQAKRVQKSKEWNKMTLTSLENANQSLERYEKEAARKIKVKARQRNLWILISAGLAYWAVR